MIRDLGTDIDGFISMVEVTGIRWVKSTLGVWGVLAAGLFSSGHGVATSYGTGSCGLFYTCDGNGGKQLVAQAVFLLASLSWTGAWCTVMFMALRITGFLRVSPEVEQVGLDVSEHGGKAFFHSEKAVADGNGLHFTNLDSPHNTA